MVLLGSKAIANWYTRSHLSLTIYRSPSAIRIHRRRAQSPRRRRCACPRASISALLIPFLAREVMGKSAWLNVWMIQTRSSAGCLRGSIGGQCTVSLPSISNTQPRVPTPVRSNPERYVIITSSVFFMSFLFLVGRCHSSRLERRKGILLRTEK